MKPLTIIPNPKLDLTMERIIDVPRALVWKAWTDPEHLKKWFCPKPWQTTSVDLDLRPGGRFNSTMEGPNGEKHSSQGCYLEVIENERISFTSALIEGFRPVLPSENGDCSDLRFTAIVMMEDHKGGTKYTVYALHPDAESRDVHNEMGFEGGWGTALDQMVEAIKSGSIR